MSDAPNKRCDWRDTAWSFVLGSSTETDVEAFQEHLLEGCAACGAELEHARNVVADLDVAVAERTLGQGHGSEPRPNVRERLLNSVASKATAFADHVSKDESSHLRATNLPGVFLAAQSEEGWRPTDIEGIDFKTLVEDADRRTATALVRMAPGTSYPPHRHALREECYVIAGDLSFGDERMTAGDYQMAEKGSVHPEQSTEDGCLLLVVSSLDDKPV